jgi:hypothetical protein
MLAASYRQQGKECGLRGWNRWNDVERSANSEKSLEGQREGPGRTPDPCWIVGWMLGVYGETAARISDS